MKNILVPTDFSPRAEGAYRYAQELALYLNASIKVIHVYHPTSDPVNPHWSLPENTMQHFVRERLKEFVGSFRQEEIAEVLTDQMLQQEVLLGFAGQEIVQLSKSDEVDLIVMGTTGKSDVFRKTFGSVSTQVARNAHCPVILVPQGTGFRDYNNMLYASNYDEADGLLLSEVLSFSALFEAQIHLVHVEETGIGGSFEVEAWQIEGAERAEQLEPAIRMTRIRSESVWSGLNRYAKDNDVDLIILATRHRKFLDKMMHKSLTRKAVLEARLPIMVLPIE